MIRSRKLIPRYVLAGTIPYVFLSLVFLTAVLFAQQASRFTELALYTKVSFSLMGQVGAALVPSVLVFTLPMAVLAGIVIGFARMGSDSEIVALRAAGVGTWTMLWPVVLLGLAGSLAATYLNLKEAPEASRDLRRATVQGALAKLESPVEPRTFTTDLPGYVIYVRDGDKNQGLWNRVFIYAPEADGSTQILTARSGRIDSSVEKSELVLSDAVKMKIPPVEGEQKPYVVEHLEQLRIAINTGRDALVQRLTAEELGPDEKDWNELRHEASSGNSKEQASAQRTVHRRLALSVAPLVFSLVAGAIGLRVRRGGRSVGVLISLVVVVVYYLFSLLGESLARAGTLTPLVGGWMATVFMLLMSFIFLMNMKVRWRFVRFRGAGNWLVRQKSEKRGAGTANVALGRRWFPSLLDLSLFRTLTTSFFLGFISLVSIFIIFTLFELWRFIAINHVRGALVFKYILFLLPLITVELFPATMLIAVLVTYALLARRSEAIAWWASGQSVYRLMLPGVLFSLAAAAAVWVVQEQLMPYSNLRQDALRAQIRGGQPRAITGTGRQWLASTETNRLYSYEFDTQQGKLEEPTIYELDTEGVHPRNVVSGRVASWSGNNLIISDARVITLKGMQVERQSSNEGLIENVEPIQVFKPTVDKPSQLSAAGLSSYLKAIKRRGVEASALAVALQRKYASPFGVLVMALLGIPLALAFGRRGAIIALCAAVGVAVAYWGVGGGFQQLGEHGLLPAAVAGWSPLVIFGAAGIYFLSRVRT
jgi:LPS export ABC transporter permease LptG